MRIIEKIKLKKSTPERMKAQASPEPEKRKWKGGNSILIRPMRNWKDEFESE